MLFAQFFSDYLTHQRALRRSPRTISNVRSSTLSLMSVLDSEVPLEAITPVHVQAWIDHQADDLACSTLKQYAQTLSAMFAYAVRLKLIPSNPVIPRDLEFPSAMQTIRPVLTSEQAMMLLQHAANWDPEFHAFVMLGFFLGLRIGQIAYLTWPHVIWPDAAGLGGSVILTEEPGQFQPKNRHVSCKCMGREDAAVLWDLYQRAKDKTGRVFARWAPATICRTIIPDMMKRVSLSIRLWHPDFPMLTSHDLRRASGVEAWRATHDLIAVQHHLDHSNTHTTELYLRGLNVNALEQSQFLRAQRDLYRSEELKGKEEPVLLRAE